VKIEPERKRCSSNLDNALASPSSRHSSLGRYDALDVTHELIALVQRAHTLGTIGDLLGWDEQVNWPPGGAEQRANQAGHPCDRASRAACELASVRCSRCFEDRPTR